MRRAILACTICVLVSALLAVAPHLTNFAYYGSPEFLADNDDIFYLAISRAPYYGEWTLRDGFLPPSEKVIDVHSWAQCVPAAKLGRLLHIPLILLGSLWRVLGGMLLALSLFVLFRRLFADTSRPIAWALGCTLICICDAGFCDGRSLVENAALLIPNLLRGTTPFDKPDAIAHFRVATPLLDLPFLIFMVAALIPADRSRTANILFGGISLGCCVLLYFYLWTAAVLALCGYLATLLWIYSRERSGSLIVQAKRVVIVLALGLSIGAPQILYNARISHNPELKPYLERSGRLTHLPANDPARTKYLLNVWVWLKLAVGAAGAFVLGQSGIILLWWLVLSGYLLANLAIFTGLEFENLHWVLVHAPMGEILILAVAVVSLERWYSAGKLRWIPQVFTPRAFRSVAWGLTGSLVLIAFVWRPYEVIRARTSIQMAHTLQELRPLRSVLQSLGTGRTLAGPWQSQVAMLHGRNAVLFFEPETPILLISMDEVNERHALNAWLKGVDEAEYQVSPTLGYTTKFGYLRPEWSSQGVARQRLAIFQRLLAQASEGERLANRFGVTDLLLPATAPAPTRAGPWRLVQSSPSWSLWTKIGGSSTSLLSYNRVLTLSNVGPTNY
jgi:hypothetical protein